MPQCKIAATKDAGCEHDRCMTAGCEIYFYFKCSVLRPRSARNHYTARSAVCISVMTIRTNIKRTDRVFKKRAYAISVGSGDAQLEK